MGRMSLIVASIIFLLRNFNQIVDLNHERIELNQKTVHAIVDIPNKNATENLRTFMELSQRWYSLSEKAVELTLPLLGDILNE